jgi:Protein of unknown function (DUF1572)
MGVDCDTIGPHRDRAAATRFLLPADRAAMSTIESVRDEFRRYKRLGDRALEQVDDESFFDAPDPEGNSLAIIVKHVGGNLRSRWLDFLTTDGEKPDRDRDGEFELRGETRVSLMRAWDRGWSILFDSLNGLSDADLERTIRIRGESHTIILAAERSLAHTAYHVGQITLLARHYAGASWTSLSIPRGGSVAFNLGMQQKMQERASS